MENINTFNNHGSTKRDGNSPNSNRFSDASEEVSELADSAVEGAKSNIADAKNRADKTISSLGHGMTSAADMLRSNTPDSGVIASTAQTVANQLETSGRYLEQHGVSDITSDLSNIVRRNPRTALGVGVGLGVLIAAAFRGRNRA